MARFFPLREAWQDGRCECERGARTRTGCPIWTFGHGVGARIVSPVETFIHHSRASTLRCAGRLLNRYTCGVTVAIDLSGKARESTC